MTPLFAKKKSRMKKTHTGNTTLDSLATLIMDTAASADAKFAAIAEDIGDMKFAMTSMESRMTGMESRMSDMEARMMGVEARMTGVETGMVTLVGEIGKVDTRLRKFEDSEVDKRLQLEVRVAVIEHRLGFDKKLAA